MGLGIGGVRRGEVASLKDMKVLIGQRGNRKVYAEGKRLWNGQAYFFSHFDCLCRSMNQKMGESERKDRIQGCLQVFHRLLLKTFIHVRAAGADCDVTEQAMCKSSRGMNHSEHVSTLLSRKTEETAVMMDNTVTLLWKM